MHDYRVIETDVLVAGGGGAGCRAAMAAADGGARVLLMEKGRLGVTGSTFDPFTHGKGISVAVKGYNPTDDPEVHYREAMATARKMARPALVRAVAYEAPDRFRELLDIGLCFRSSQVGSCFGETMRGTVIDQPSLAQAFRREIGRRDIQVMERTMVADLLKDGRRCSGAVAVTHRGEVVACRAKAVILATGGVSSMFRYHFSAPALTGDGYAMALRAGAELTNLEYYQSILGTTQPARLFLPQWYLAGNPAFYNAQGRHFLPDYVPAAMHPDQLVVERSLHGPFSFSRPSGWVDIAIHSELQAGRGTAPWGDERRLAGVYCDFASLPVEVRRELDGRFLPALGWLKARGLDFEQAPIPVAPFAHAFNGGIVIDENAATGVPGLYACGEVAAGPHGANRLGGHMFAVLLVFGKRAGEAAARRAAESPPPDLERDDLHRQVERIQALRSATGQVRPHELRRAIQRAMSPIMIAKDAARLEIALAALAETRQAIIERVGLRVQPDLFEAMGVASLLEIAALLARAALLRRESRGPHYRTDYPEERDGEFGKNLLWKVDGDATSFRWASL
jgi:fumarate reductase (CoM/CoB) subunit A